MRVVTREIHVGGVPVGGTAPIAVQSMTTKPTRFSPLLMREIAALRDAGATIVRVACPDRESVDSLRKIAGASDVDLVADVHFRPDFAELAIESGVSGIRLDPGNIRDPEAVVRIGVAAAKRDIAVRVGVNSGSVDPKFLAKYGGPTVNAMVESAIHYTSILEGAGVQNLKISAKATTIRKTVRAYELLSEATDWPLHVGLTEAGPLPGAQIKTCAAVGSLLLRGIGDTIRFSFSEDPVTEVRSAVELLEVLELRPRLQPEIVACPSCARADIDVLTLAQQVHAATRGRNLPLRIAVMGCEVNGPGEAREADVGIAGGNGRGQLIVEGEVVRTVPETEMVAALLEVAEEVAERRGLVESVPEGGSVGLPISRPRNDHSITSARALIMTPDQSVLLLQYRAPGQEERIWTLPGGHIEVGESPLNAVIREVMEETGLEMPRIRRHLGVFRQDLSWSGDVRSDVEALFAFDIPKQVDVSPTHLSADERASFVRAKWWSIDEIEESTERFHPQTLALILRQRSRTNV